MERLYSSDSALEKSEPQFRKSELDNLTSDVLSYWGNKGYTQLSNGFPLLTSPKSLLLANSTIAPYIDRIKPNSLVEVNDVLLQKCIRLNYLENNGLLSSEEWTTSFIMGGIVTSKAKLSEVINDTYHFFVNNQGVREDKLRITVNPRDSKSVQALKETNIRVNNIELLDGTDDIWVNWQFGVPGPNGDGITFSLLENGLVGCSGQFLNIIHIDKYLDENGAMQDLPYQVIDMGFGLERFINLKKGVGPFDTAIYQEYIKPIQAKVGMDGENKLRILSIADNIRNIKFMLAEGIIPDKKAEGYLSRRLARNIFLQLDLLGCINTRDLYENLFSIEERQVLDSEYEAYKKNVLRASTVIGKLKLNQFSSRGDFLWFLKDTHGIPEEISIKIIRELYPEFMIFLNQKNS